MKHLLLALAFCAGTGVALGADNGVDNLDLSAPTVRLPEFVVKADRVAPDSEHWLYAQVPGYEILSQLSAARTANLAADLARTSSVIAQFWPAINTTPDVQTSLILAGSTADFHRFMPEKVVQEVGNLTLVDRLFLHGDESDAVVLDVSGLNDAGNYRADLIHAYVARRLAAARPAFPPWFIEGMAQIIANSDYEDTTVTVGDVKHDQALGSALQPPQTVGDQMKLDPDVQQIVQGVTEKMIITNSNAVSDLFPGVATTTDGVVAQQATGGGAISSTDNTFVVYFGPGNHAFPPLADLFSGKLRSSPTLWKMASWEFVHFCLFNWQPEMKDKLYQFLQQVMQHPQADPEPFFYHAFGRSYASMGASLHGYADSISYRAQRYPLSPAEQVDISDASDGTIAQIKGDAYRLAGYSDEGYAELITDYHRDNLLHRPHEPRLLAALGVAVWKNGDTAKARMLLEAAEDRGWHSTPALLALCQLRTDAAGTGALSPAQTAACLTPLFQALSHCPPDAEVYERIAQVWARSSAKPSQGNLAVLDQGIALFPGNTGLALDAARLNLANGYSDHAKKIADYEIAISPDGSGRSQFAAFEPNGS